MTDSPNVRLAVSALLAMLFTLVLGLATALAGQHPLPELILVVNGTMMTTGLFALPLVWWHSKAGYACAMAVGVSNVLLTLTALATGLPLFAGQPSRALTMMILQILMSAIVVFACARAWSEPTAV
ncbi:MAG TPA: hypothetical protein VNK41_06725 [Vicinamibacterales bacterium]|nr:hypothetical protein [Vicinamibacterales bacterium]